VPPEEISSPRQLSRPYAKPLPNEQSFPETAIFCSTCLKNQHLLTRTLANYLPSSDDPRYDQFEASYPEFRQKLEERYPPVCARCEPGATRQIQQAGYTAKSDHLRRMMERTRARRIASRWGWRSLVVTSGEVLYWTSILGQLVWDIVTILEESEQNARQSSTLNFRSMLCTAQVFTEGKTDSGCTVEFVPTAYFALVCGFLSSWWNPKWHHRLQGREGRLTGLRGYYQVNMAVLLARFGFLAWNRQFTTAASTDVVQKVAHALAMVLTLVLTSYSLSRVKIDTAPLVSWQNSPAPLLSQRQYSPPILSGEPQPLSVYRGSRLETSMNQSFPISSLAPEPRRDIWQAPTPPPDEDQDVMEWEPSQVFRPKARLQQVNGPPAPSPFHGALPTKPTNRLLYPPQQRQAPQKEAIGLPPGFFDRRDRLKTGSDAPSLPAMAQPKFFSYGDRVADTGLENIFDAVFSLHDAPAVPTNSVERQPIANQDQQAQRIVDDTRSMSYHPWHYLMELNVLRTVKLLVFTTGLFVFYAAQELQLDVPHLKLVIICFAGSISLISAFSEHMKLKPDVSDLLWSWFMAFATGLLVFQQWSHSNDEPDMNNGRMAMIFLVLCSCWELPRLFDWHTRYSSKDQPHSKVSAKSFRETQTHRAMDLGADQGQPQSEPSPTDNWQPTLSEARLSVSPSSTWQPQSLSSFKPASSQIPEKRPSYRARSDSTDSSASHSSISTTATATTAGWKTPNFRAQQQFNSIHGQSPGFNLRSLALDDRLSMPRRQEQNGFGRSSGRF
jgi:Ima1 N-terminal domain